MIINSFISFFNEMIIQIFVNTNRNFQNMFFEMTAMNICEYNIIYNKYSLKKNNLLQCISIGNNLHKLHKSIT